jgi:hypothetical protein
VANRYWVGDTGNINDTANWSASSGGSGGASVPTSADNAIFDGNSFSTTGLTVSFDAAFSCLDLDFSAVTNSPTIAKTTGGAINVYGHITLHSSLTWTATLQWVFRGTATKDIDFAGLNLGASPTSFATYGKMRLTSSFTTGRDWILYYQSGGGLLDLNGFTLECRQLLSQYGAGATRELKFGSGTLKCTSRYKVFGTGLTLTRDTGQVLMLTGTDFQGGGLTYYNVRLDSASTIAITGANTYNQLQIGDGLGSAARTVTFLVSETHTIEDDFVAIASSGKLITISSSSAGTQFTLSKSSGEISCDYVSLKDSAATGGAGWYAGANSTDVSGNSGWVFTPPPTIRSMDTIAGTAAVIAMDKVLGGITVAMDTPDGEGNVVNFLTSKGPQIQPSAAAGGPDGKGTFDFGWTVVGAARKWAAVDDPIGAPNDLTDYIQADNPNPGVQIARVSFATATIQRPVSNAHIKITKVEVGFRAKRSRVDGPAPTLDGFVYLVNEQWVHDGAGQTVSATFADYVTELVSRLDGRLWTWDNLVDGAFEVGQRADVDDAAVEVTQVFLKVFPDPTPNIPDLASDIPSIAATGSVIDMNATLGPITVVMDTIAGTGNVIDMVATPGPLVRSMDTIAGSGAVIDMPTAMARGMDTIVGVGAVIDMIYSIAGADVAKVINVDLTRCAQIDVSLERSGEITPDLVRNVQVDGDLKR